MNDTGASTTLESQRQGFRLLWIVTVLVNLAVIGLVVLVIQHNREREIAQATLLTENYSKILEQNLSGFFSKIDITLLTLRDEVVREKQQGGINDQEIRAFITRQDAHLPEALGLRVVDAQGIIRFAVKDVKIPNASIADRPQFIKMRDDPEAGLVLSKPVLGRTSGKSIITISRRINNPDGSFAGDVHVAVEINYFINQFSKINLGPNGNIGIWDKSSLIARYSLTDRNGASVGASTPSRQLHDLLNSDRSLATYHARSGIDGVSRIYSFRKMNDVPLFLLVGIADQDYLAEWQSDSLHLVALASLFVFASLVSSMLIYRNLKQREIYHQHLHSQEAEYSAKLEQSRYEAEAARQQSNLLLTSAGEGICGVDREGKLVFINPAARNMFGWAVDEGIGQSLHELTHHHYPDGRDYPMESCPIFETLRDGQWRMLKEDVYWRKDGTSFPVELTVSAIRQGEQITGAVNVFRDISERKKLEERIIHMALFDELTGLPNRSFLLDTLPRVVASSQRRQESLGFLYLDLDGFKNVNDTMGHAAGDEVLRKVASRLRACTRADDVTVRLGGDEFLVLTSSGKENIKENCIMLANRVIEAIKEPIPLAKGLAQVGTSIGIVFLSECPDSAEHCIQLADAAMYRAKLAGKGQYAFSDN